MADTKETVWFNDAPHQLTAEEAEALLVRTNTLRKYLGTLTRLDHLDAALDQTIASGRRKAHIPYDDSHLHGPEDPNVETLLSSVGAVVIYSKYGFYARVQPEELPIWATSPAL